MTNDFLQKERNKVNFMYVKEGKIRSKNKKKTLTNEEKQKLINHAKFIMFEELMLKKRDSMISSFLSMSKEFEFGEYKSYRFNLLIEDLGLNRGIGEDYLNEEFKIQFK